MNSRFYSCARCYGKNLTKDDFEFDENDEKFKTCNKCREYDKHRKAQNKEVINKQAREHYQTIHEEKIEQVKQYRNDNREKLHEIQRCECGGKYIYRAKCQHVKSKRHINYIESLIQ